MGYAQPRTATASTVLQPLRGPRPVAPHGVRLAQQMLADGAGALYVPGARGDLRATALRALGALDAHGAGR